MESRLDSQSFSAMQAALLMNKLKQGAAVAESSKLMAAVAAAAAAASASTGGKDTKDTDHLNPRVYRITDSFNM